LLVIVLHDDQFTAGTRQLFAHALNTGSLDTELHELMRDFGGFALDFAAKTDDKGDYLALNLFEGGQWWQQDQGKVKLVGEGASLLAQRLK
jgi:hypothetical protein